ncbi:Similar to Polr1a: DNA-directed RNA polymerase I subunit RPA1 (Mus musculus) [Cotesia congregata]|uniref:DNA-directed RNA polymerase subunit n=1 Tax=Cotesia congregata TaxID=51543 RepID=A0A8J2H9E8_COTCN|nr:Similar to Polr1a: DNA-directed RNA polymerase I subunit RPA1 (Mus musculus) [Cotesia congregata]
MNRIKSQISPKHLDPSALTLSMYTTEEIKKMSELKIVTPLTFNILGHSITGGVYDSRLGPISFESEPCGTCSYTFTQCEGHFGHIELPVPVINPLFYATISSLLRISCSLCHTLQMSSLDKLVLEGRHRMICMGFYSELEELEQELKFLIDEKKTNGVLSLGEIVALREVMDRFIENRRPKSSSSDQGPTVFSKNINLQWIRYIDGALKLAKDNLQKKSHGESGKMCLYCTRKLPKIKVTKNKFIMQILSEDTGVTNYVNAPVTPDKCRELLRNLWKQEEVILRALIPVLSTVKTTFPTDIFFLEVVSVIPPRARPINKLKNQIIEHPQNQAYKSILSDCLVIKNIIKVVQDGDTRNLPQEGVQVYKDVRGTSAIEKLHNAWQILQANVDHLMDRDMTKTNDSANCEGFKQIIEKKAGVIRMHMMGKRVNFAARSVITPDPNINIDEIGIPEVFARKLSYPVAVTPWNVTELRQMVINGPDVHPGAMLIEGGNGWIQRLSATDPIQRKAIAKRLLSSNKDDDLVNSIKIVHRHLQNGDIMLLNRQPTLHKPSIMAHKARILKGEQTLRLHYSNCKAYNADFDGDEMNAHLPQNEVGRSEGYNLAGVSHQYLVPKDGTPLGGLIQDHVIGGVRLTLRGTFLIKNDYLNLVYSALSDSVGKVKLLPPTILKPVYLWTGKQVVSTVIINLIPQGKALINLNSKNKISPQAWINQPPRAWKCGEQFKDEKTMSEAEVILRGGELLCGIIEKTHYGATPYGLIHCVYELYGGECSIRMLSSFGRLFQYFLTLKGFTLGVKDILVVSSGDKKREKAKLEGRLVGQQVQKEVLELPEEIPYEEIKHKMDISYITNPKFRAQVDHKYKIALHPVTDRINSVTLKNGLLKKFPGNNLQFMVQTGAKGSDVNRLQISGLCGQIELEGKRPPLNVNGQGLPCFKEYDPSPRAGGYVDARFMTGIQPPEFFFHCMAGREGLIDTAVKTSRSGYLQRCLIKHLEGLAVHYDGTIRDSDGSLIQFLYGEDGEDILKCQFLNSSQMDFLVDNKNAILDKKLVVQLKDDNEYSHIMKRVKKIRKWRTKNGSEIKRERTSPFARFSADNIESVSKKNKIDPASGRSKVTLALIKKWQQCDEKEKNKYEKQCVRCPEPIIAEKRQDLDYGVLSERLESLIDDYKKSKNSKKISYEDLRDMMCLKLMKTLCPAGEPVGLLAAQSIGEPSTQMTLNTFHFAGRGDMNVTLGIPRLREILMMASRNIKTPSMEIPFLKGLKNVEKAANRVKAKLTRCTMADILKDIRIEREMVLKPSRRLEYKFTVEFLHRKHYKNDFCLTAKEVLARSEALFVKELVRQINKAAKKTGINLIEDGDKRSKKKKEAYDDSVLDGNLDDDDDDDNVNVKPKSQKKHDGEAHESSDEEDAGANDAETAEMAKKKKRHTDTEEYEEDPEADEAPEPDAEEIFSDVEDDAMDKKDGETDDESENDVLTPEMLNSRLEAAETRKNIVLAQSNWGLEYNFDVTKYHWFTFKFWLPLDLIKLDMPTILRETTERVVLWETPAIKRAFTFENNGEIFLKTDGLNIIEMAKYVDILDLNRLYTNDIYGISQTYGIEAANRVIVKEVTEVFKMYGITVDPRHLSLIADYMTYEGSYQPLSRRGMESSASPLQQMTFESSVAFLKTATVRAKTDNLMAPSGRLMLGQPCKSGTGCFDLLFKFPANTNAHQAFSPK